MFIQPVTGYRKVVTPAFRSQAENPLLKQSDITRLDSKLVIGRAPGACRYENHQYKINSNILDKDLQFLKSNYNVDTLIENQTSLKAFSTQSTRQRVMYIYIVTWDTIEQV